MSGVLPILNGGDSSVLNSKIAAAIIAPTYNIQEYVAEALESVLSQTGVDLLTLELILFDDSSTDSTFLSASALLPRLQASLGRTVFLRGSGGPHGSGFARNRAVEASSAPVLIFLDTDDIMLPSRVGRTLAALGRDGSAAVVGGNFTRFPAGSTPRYQAHHDRISGSSAEGDGLFVHAFRDAPLAMPTVACRLCVWISTGGFVEGTRISEDLHFMYAAMEKGYVLDKLDGEALVLYRWHDRMTSNILTRLHMLSVRVDAFEKLVLAREKGWEMFSIWGAGRDGKDFYKRLSDGARTRIKAWGEINPRKIGLMLHGKPIVHWSELKPPVATCVALDRTDGMFEGNLASMNFAPGSDFVYIN